MKRFLIPGIMACLLIWPATTAAEDWDACHEALKALRVAARRASFETLETHRKEKQLATCQDQTRTVDLCRTVREELRFQRQKVRSALAGLQAAIFQAELSCRQCLPLGPDGPPPNDQRKLWQDMCARLQSATAGMSPQERAAFCRQVHFPGDCAECLDPRASPADANPNE